MDAVNLRRKIDAVKTSFPTKKKKKRDEFHPIMKGMKRQIDGTRGLET